MSEDNAGIPEGAMGGAGAEAERAPFGGERAQLMGEGEGTLFLYKPPGMTVFPSRAHPERPCVLDALLAALPAQGERPWPEGFEGGILHRLDTATSGLIVAAQDLKAFHRLRSAFGEGRLLKTYLFLSAGPGPEGVPLEEGAWWADAPLAHHKKNRGKMIAQRATRTPHRGRWFEAQTRVSPEVHDGALGLFQAQMKTGVTHQIRVHGATLSLPILGDTLYGGEAHPGPAPEAPFFLHHLHMEGLGPCPRAALPETWRAVMPRAGGPAGASEP